MRKASKIAPLRVFLSRGRSLFLCLIFHSLVNFLQPVFDPVLFR